MDLSKIIQHNLPDTNYNSDEFPKSQIFLHHTAGNDNATGVVDDWKHRTDKVATAFVIDAEGDIVQAFSSKKWAYHLGLQVSTFRQFNLPYQSLDRISIAIELCNWGYLAKDQTGYVTYVGSHVNEQNVVTLDKPFRGFGMYHKYTPAQLNALEDILLYLCGRYNIPKQFNANMFDVNADALKGTPGIWSHTSVRFDKTDCSPQPALIEMLQGLSSQT